MIPSKVRRYNKYEVPSKVSYDTKGEGLRGYTVYGKLITKVPQLSPGHNFHPTFTERVYEQFLTNLQRRRQKSYEHFDPGAGHFFKAGRPLAPGVEIIPYHTVLHTDLN